jgi:hypothetical protein
MARISADSPLARSMLNRPSMVPGLRRWHLWAGALLAAVAVLPSRTAQAQTTGTGTGGTCPGINITVSQTVPRFPIGNQDDNPQDPFPSRDQNLDPNAINYNDCNSDIHLQFTGNVSGLPCTDTMQIWAGTTDCTATSARQANSGAAHCWPVTGTVALQTAFTLNIRAEDLVAFISNSEPPSTYAPQGAKTACRSQIAPGVVSLGVYFMAMEADGLTMDGTPAMYSLDVALVGPDPPTNLTAGVGENLIVASWTPSIDSTIQGFNVYCQDQGANGGDAGLLEAGLPEATLICPDTGPTVAGDAEAGTSTPAATDACVSVNMVGTGAAGGATCVSNVLVDQFQIGASLSTDGGEAGIVSPVVPDANTGEASVPVGTAVGISDVPSMYLCGVAGGNTTNSLVITAFSDGGAEIKDFTQYAVAVAATDGVGNIGLLSNLACVTPAPVVTFWDRYLEDGGLAGGGFCALQGAGIPVGGSLFGIGMSAAALAYVRRRGRRSR